MVRAARGRLRPYVRDVRSWEVGLPHSTGEAAEQGRVSGCGGGGGKGAARGERGQQNALRTQSRVGASSALDRVRRCGVVRSGVRPERGAQCGSSACWDLCGGPPERAVPTATWTVVTAVKPRHPPQTRKSLRDHLVGSPRSQSNSAARTGSASGGPAGSQSSSDRE
jgi:hypothetical protein